MSKKLDFYEVTNGMSPEEIGSGLIEGVKSSQLMSREVEFPSGFNVAIIGASIMEDAFLNGGEERMQQRLFSLGKNCLSVNSYAVSGDNSTDALAKKNSIITDYSGEESSTIVVVHIGGNDITQNGPYPGGASTLETNLTTIINDLVSAGFTVMPSTITYRIPPASNPSAPYNQLTLIPLYSSIASEALTISGRPIIDLYQLTSTTYEIHNDGVHYTQEGSNIINDYISDRIAKYVVSEIPTPQTISDVVVDLGGTFTTSSITSVGVGQSSPILYKQSDGSLTSLTLGFSGFGINGENDDGKSYGITTYSLGNNQVTRDSFFVSYPDFVDYQGDTGTVSISGDGIEPSAVYDVSFVASRNTNDSIRWGTYTAGGQSVDINAADELSASPEIETITGVTGQQLIDNGITVVRKDPELNSFAYLNGFRIIKTS